MNPGELFLLWLIRVPRSQFRLVLSRLYAVGKVIEEGRPELSEGKDRDGYCGSG